MTGFLIFFFSIYSIAHAFVYSRVRVLLPANLLFHFLLLSFMALMMLAPVGARLFERSDHYFLARLNALVGYGWLAFLFYAFWGFLLIGAVGVICKLCNVSVGTALPTFAGPTTAVCVLLSALAINIYGYFEARSIRVERIVIRTPKLPAGTDRLRIAQISDVHLGLMAREERLSGILAGIQAENPDILVSTGDLVDGNMEKIEGLKTIFEKLKPRLGKYAVTGNHEVYAGLSESIPAEKAFGFTVLNGVVKTVSDTLNIAGIDDPAAGLAENEKEILEKAQNGLFTLLLKHRPEPAAESLGLFDLQLSGHTHYGQLFPFRYVTGLFYPFQKGIHYLSKGSILYASRGSGTWGPSVRVLATPEVTIFDIVRQ